MASSGDELSWKCPESDDISGDPGSDPDMVIAEQSEVIYRYLILSNIFWGDPLLSFLIYFCALLSALYSPHHHTFFVKN